MGSGFEITLELPYINDITTGEWYFENEGEFPVGIPETHEVRGYAWVINNDWQFTITVDVRLWLQDPMGNIRGYRKETFTLAPAEWAIMATERVVLDLPGLWRLQGRYLYGIWDWSRSWEAIDCQVIEYALTLTSQNGGSIQAYVAGQEITVGPGQTKTIEGVPRGSTVGLQAFPSSGYKFKKWSGEPVNGETSTMVQFEMMGDYDITASWELQDVDPGAIEGVVMEYETGEPISGATVKSGIYSDTTDLQGSYEIAGIPPGQYKFSYSASGYSTEERDVLIQSGRTTKLDVALKAADNGNGNGEDGEVPEWEKYLKWGLIGGGILIFAVTVRSAMRKGEK